MGESVNQEVFGDGAYVIPELEDHLKRNILNQELFWNQHQTSGTALPLIQTGVGAVDGETLFPLMFNVSPMMSGRDICRHIPSSGRNIGFKGEDLDAQIDFTQFNDLCAAENLHTEIFFISSVLPNAPSDVRTIYVEDRIAEDHFIATSSSKLFTKALVPLRDMDSGVVLGMMRVYYVNFGKDIKNAARMMSEVIDTLAPRSDGWRHTSYTSIDEDKEENHSELTKQQNKAGKSRIGTIIAIIISILIAIILSTL